MFPNLKREPRVYQFLQNKIKKNTLSPQTTYLATSPTSLRCLSSRSDVCVFDTANDVTTPPDNLRR